ncbi:MAG: tRNA adenosine(34) deaminase TadA [Cardiobacteriaceae bacterium]|nr:tRNA adenosine(34) deaminase TadA [Cardiobacteriaceae bacterium]
MLKINSLEQEKIFMQEALKAAKQAFDLGEIPIGAVVVNKDGELIASAFNSTIRNCDPTAHAEILALQMAAKNIGNYRLSECSLFVTIEPCVMCIGAIIQARVQNLYFGANNLKGGAGGSCFDLYRNKELNHSLYSVKSGILAEECRNLMQNFFQNKRK